jgi:hypothetical protein
LAVQEIKKPGGAMCIHCQPDQGCSIYDARPAQCRLFNCHFLTDRRLREEWRPSKSRIVVVVSPDGLRIAANVDPDRPGAWQREPFYSTFKKWAQQAVATPGVIGQVLVSIGKRTLVILPDRDVDMGIVEDDEVVITEGIAGPKGLALTAFKMRREDPRAKSILGAIEQEAGIRSIF